MADKDDVQKQEGTDDAEQQVGTDSVEQQEGTDQTEKQKESKAEKSDKAASSNGILPWIIMFVVVVICAGAGLVAGRFVRDLRAPETGENSKEDRPARIESLNTDDSAETSQEVWYYDLEPVVANLDETGVARYVRLSLTLGISSNVDKEKGTAFLDRNKPHLRNWLTIYLASLCLEDIRGDKNLRLVQSQILDGINEELFPNTKPQIKEILLKEFAIQ